MAETTELPRETVQRVRDLLEIHAPGVFTLEMAGAVTSAAVASVGKGWLAAQIDAGNFPKFYKESDFL